MQHPMSSLAVRFVGGLAFLSMLVSRLSGADVVRFDGLTDPYREIGLAAGEPGVIHEVLIREGEQVEAGQVLAKLDTAVLECTLEIARQRSRSTGALQAAEAERDLRQKYLDQLSQLRDRGHSTQREIDRAEADLRVAEARLAIAQEEIELQLLECRRIEAQIERRTIRAPLTGVVSEVLRDVGESFMSSDARVVTVVQLDRLRAKFPVDPATAAQLTLGQSHEVEFVDSGNRVPAVVETISPVIDAKSDTVLVTVVIDNSEETLRSGARCVLNVPIGSSASGTATQFTSKRRPAQQ
ncbi:MAG: efflux RND transporter periplasmic adaptor subunit [Planctomycetales bacterium]|nr:efflux RND transporter periplasmic adaptor subunit [Planctomycetales bacterium]